MASPNPEANQINFRLPWDEIKEIDEAAERFSMTRAQIFQELYKLYFEYWVQAAEAKKKVLDQQFAGFNRPAGQQKK